MIEDPRETVLVAYGFNKLDDMWRLHRGERSYYADLTDKTTMSILLDTPEKVEAFCILMGITK